MPKTPTGAKRPADVTQNAVLVMKIAAGEAEEKTAPKSAAAHRMLSQPIKDLVSTSCVEKHNQTMRQRMRRFTRLTNGHSKKIDNHVHMVALYTTWYNFARINSAVRMSPAMAARLTDQLWDIGDVVKPIEKWESQRNEQN